MRRSERSRCRRERPVTGASPPSRPLTISSSGSLVLQADDLTLSSGGRVWVNIDPSKKPTGRLSDKHTHFYVLPIPIGIVPATFTSVSGNLILDAGTAFRVVTIPPRASPAPLVTAPPTAAASPAHRLRRRRCRLRARRAGNARVKPLGAALALAAVLAAGLRRPRARSKVSTSRSPRVSR